MPQFNFFDSYLKHNVTIDTDTLPEDYRYKIYACGPTIYSYQHLGNMFAAFIPTTIRDLLLLAGVDAELAINITDVGHLTGDNEGNADSGEDRMQKSAIAENKSPKEIAEFYLAHYRKSLELLNITLPISPFNPLASSFITEQLILALTLLTEDKAYMLEDGIYFDSEKNSEALERVNNLAGMPKTNGDNSFQKREIANTTKNPSDFAIWKFVTPDTLQKWRIDDYTSAGNTQFNDQVLLLLLDLQYIITGSEYVRLQTTWGCPGWHSECVAMIAKILGRKYSKKRNQFSFGDFKGKTLIDLHMGGIEHLPLHHRNEILQSEGLGFHLSKNWMHWQHVLTDGKKISKSLKNTVLVTGAESETGFKSLEEMEINPLSYRMLMFEHSYQSSWNFTIDKITQASSRLLTLRKQVGAMKGFVSKNRIYQCKNQNPETQSKYLELILQKGLNNWNLPQLLEEYQNQITICYNSMPEGESFDNFDLNLFHVLMTIDTELLKLDLFKEPSEDAITLAKNRQKAKENKDYKLADEIRNQASEQGYQIDDYKWGFSIWQG